MKTAIIHDWLVRERGGEKVLEHIARLYPDADIFTLFYRKGNLPAELKTRNIRASILQLVPGIEKFYRFLLPLFPFLIESFNLNGYDRVISSSHCVAKGVRIPEGAVHLCYCHTPMRYAWMFQEEYLRGKFYGPLALFILNQLRKWDLRTAERVHHFAANSKEVQSRIERFYGRKSEVINPPLDLSFDGDLNVAREYFLIVSALVPYKKIDLAVEAFNELGLPLKIVGTGPDARELARRAQSNIEFLGWVGQEKLKEVYSRAKALIFPGLEDFGITPLEAQAAGTPVIAYGRGGVTETVTSRTGIFFDVQSKEALKNAVRRFQSSLFNREAIRDHARAFGGNAFDQKFSNWVKART